MDLSASALCQQLSDRSTFLNLNKFVIVDLVQGLEKAIASRNILDDILTMYPAATARLLTYMLKVSDLDYSLPSDDFLKDLRFASGLSVPSGS